MPPGKILKLVAQNMLIISLNMKTGYIFKFFVLNSDPATYIYTVQFSTSSLRDVCKLHSSLQKHLQCLAKSNCLVKL